MHRKALPPGTRLRLGSEIYTILTCLDRGGSALLYAARTGESPVPVVLKETFPASGYQRGSSGEITALAGQTSVLALEALKRRKMVVRTQETDISQRAAYTNYQVVPVERIYDACELAWPEGAFHPVENQYAVLRDLSGSALPLGVYLSRRGRLPLRELLNIMVTVLRGFAALHEDGYLHGDVSRGNLFLMGAAPERGDCGTAAILDFGSSRKLEHGEAYLEPGEPVFTTAGYAAPELLLPGEYQSRVTAAADVYSLGVLMLSLARELPFLRELTGREAALYLLRYPDEAEVLWRERPEGCGWASLLSLNRILERALRRNPAERYPNAGAMLLDVLSLQNALELRVEERVTPELLRHASERLLREEPELARTGHQFPDGETLRLRLYARPEDGKPEPLQPLLDRLSPEGVLLEAPGGGGKTFALRELFLRHLLREDLPACAQSGQVPVYLDLERYGREERRHPASEPSVLSSMIANQLFHQPELAGKVFSLLRGETGETSDRVLLILDNLHKAEPLDRALRELQALREFGAVSIVAACRSLPEDAPVSCRRARIVPLPEDVCAAEIETALGIRLSEGQLLTLRERSELIGLPMFLTLTLERARSTGRLEIASSLMRLLRDYFRNDACLPSVAGRETRERLLRLAFDFERAGVYERTEREITSRFLTKAELRRAEELRILVHAGGRLRFAHDQYQLYFAAERLAHALEASEVEGVSALEVFRASPLPVELLEALGQILGEDGNRPVYDDGRGVWKYGVPDPETCAEPERDRCLIDQALKLLRGQFGPDPARTVANLISVLKVSRQDLRGADLSRLDLSLSDLNECCLGQDGLCADLRGSLLSEGTLLSRGHAGRVWSVSCSPDGRRIVTASEDKTVRIWDAEHLELLRTFRGDRFFGGILGSMLSEFSPDGKWIVVGAGDGTVLLLDGKTLQPKASVKAHEDAVTSVDFHPRQPFLVTGSKSGRAKLWSIPDLEPLDLFSQELPSKALHAAGFSPDGRQLAVSSRKTVTIWKFSPDGRAFAPKTLQMPEPKPSKKSLGVSFAFDPKGKWIVTADGNRVVFWDRSYLAPVYGFSLAGVVTAVTYHPNGRFLMCQYVLPPNGCCYVYLDIEAKEPLKEFLFLMNEACTLSGAFTLEGASFAVFHSMPNLTQAVVYDLKQFHFKTYLVGGQRRQFSDAQWFGAALLTRSIRETLWWEKDESGRYRPIRTIPAPDQDLFWYAADGPDGTQYETAVDSPVLTVRNGEGETLGTLELGFPISTLSCSPTGDRLIVAGKTGEVVCVDTRGDSEIENLPGHESEVRSVTHSLDGKRLLTRSWSSLKVWSYDGARYRILREMEMELCFCADLRPDGLQIAVAEPSSEIRILDTDTFRELRSLGEATSFVKSIRYSEDGRQLVTTHADSTIMIWDAETGECLQTLPCAPGVQVVGCDLRELHPDSGLSEEAREILRDYGAVL